MSVSVRVPTILRTYTKDAAEVTAEGDTLKAVLADLEANYPGIQARILDDSGKVRRFVNVYVGDEDVRFTEGLDTAVADGSQISIILLSPVGERGPTVAVLAASRNPRSPAAPVRAGSVCSATVTCG